jgi:hypothetical protein
MGRFDRLGLRAAVVAAALLVVAGGGCCAAFGFFSGVLPKNVGVLPSRFPEVPHFSLMHLYL